MPHPLELEYGLSADELLEAISKRFRAKVTLEGAVAEVHLAKQIVKLRTAGTIDKFEENDRDKEPDFYIWRQHGSHRIAVECKNVRDANEGYRKNGNIVAYKVETQKTRTSNEDRSSRFYDVDYFNILAVCLGKKTGNWQEFIFINASNLRRHPKFPNKLAVMHPVPLPRDESIDPWRLSLHDVVMEF